MKIFIISVVKNESDIIESFVRHNLCFADRLIILDNNSSDTTGLILENLKKENLPIDVFPDSDMNHNQSAKMTRLIKDIIRQEKFDFIIPLDADEFILSDDRKCFENMLLKTDRTSCGLIPWVTYVPTFSDNWSEQDTLLRIRHRRTKEPTQYYKIIIPYELTTADGFIVGEGNHFVHLKNNYKPKHILIPEVSLAHIPVRSPEQFMGKIIIGEWALKTKLHRGASETYHWTQLYNKFVQTMDVTYEEIQEVAKSYALINNKNEQTEITESPIKIQTGYCIRYSNLIDTTVIRRVVSHCRKFFDQYPFQPFKNKNISIGKTPYGYVAYHNGDMVIGRSVQLYGEWGRHEIEFLKQLIRKGNTVVDIGANIGTHTIAFADFVGNSGRVYAFEPQRIVHQLLCTSITANNLENVITLQMGAGNIRQTVLVPPIYLSAQNSGNLNIENCKNGEPVSVICLDDLNLNPNLIRIHVEGMEQKVIEGAEKTIERCKPFLFVENNIEQNSAKLIRKLFDLGYRCWWHLMNYYNPNNYYGCKTNIFSAVDRPDINIFCCHRSRTITVNGLVEILNEQDNWRKILSNQ